MGIASQVASEPAILEISAGLLSLLTAQHSCVCAFQQYLCRDGAAALDCTWGVLVTLELCCDGEQPVHGVMKL